MLELNASTRIARCHEHSWLTIYFGHSEKILNLPGPLFSLSTIDARVWHWTKCNWGTLGSCHQYYAKCLVPPGSILGSFWAIFSTKNGHAILFGSSSYWSTGIDLRFCMLVSFFWCQLPVLCSLSIRLYFHTKFGPKNKDLYTNFTKNRSK